jgi:hypothetical protein
MRRSSLRRTLGIVGCTLVVGGSALADPSRAIVLGPRAAGSPCPMPHLDTEGSSRTTLRLGGSPVVRWRTRLSSEPAGPALVDDQGTIFVLSRTGQTRQLDARGRTLWDTQVGEAIAAPAVLVDGGHRALLTTSTRLLLFDNEGKVHLDRRLSSASAALATLLPLRDGTLLVSVADDLVQVSPNGQTLALFSVPEPPHAVLENDSGVVLVGRGGTVFLWSEPMPLQTLGTLGGRPTGHSLSSAGRLVAVVDQDRLVALDLSTGRRTILLQAPLNGATASRGAEILALTRDGSIVTVGSQGTGEEPWTGLGAHPGRDPRGTHLMLGPGGRAILTSPERGLATLGPEGQVHWLSPPPCNAPQAASPHGPDAFVLTCADGTVALLESPSAPTRAPPAEF